MAEEEKRPDLAGDLHLFAYFALRLIDVGAAGSCFAYCHDGKGRPPRPLTDTPDAPPRSTDIQRCERATFAAIPAPATPMLLQGLATTSAEVRAATFSKLAKANIRGADLPGGAGHLIRELGDMLHAPTATVFEGTP